MGKLFEFLQEDSGGFSYMRVAGFIITGAILFKNVYLSIKSGTDISLSYTDAGIITMALGIKAWQKNTEIKNENVVPIVPKI